MNHRISSALAACLVAELAAAQDAPQSAPQSSSGASGQASRFSSEFNPAFSFIVDGALAYSEPFGSDEGFDLSLRTLELGANAWIDPSAWAYFIAAVEDEALNAEEAAVHYTGLGGGRVVRAGRFFVDFGKQMQVHQHELRTLERPLALRVLLGEEVNGDGVQFDDWTAVGDATVVRWSLAALSGTLPEAEDDFDAELEPVRETRSARDVADLEFTARVTGVTDLSDRSTFQLGVSVRGVPSYDAFYETDDTTRADDLSFYVYGADATYGWTSESGERKFELGAEALFSTGDSGVELDNPTPGSGATGDESLIVRDHDLTGCFAWSQLAFDRFHSLGAQYSRVEYPNAGATDADEYELNVTRSFSEYHRLRFALIFGDGPDTDDTYTALALQYTAIAGAHGHGLNW